MPPRRPTPPGGPLPLGSQAPPGPRALSPRPATPPTRHRSTPSPHGAPPTPSRLPRPPSARRCAPLGRPLRLPLALVRRCANRCALVFEPSGGLPSLPAALSVSSNHRSFRGPERVAGGAANESLLRPVLSEASARSPPHRLPSVRENAFLPVPNNRSGRPPHVRKGQGSGIRGRPEPQSRPDARKPLPRHWGGPTGVSR